MACVYFNLIVTSMAAFVFLVRIWLLLSVSEGAFSVKTEFVSVDFNDSAAAYSKIRPHLDNKDIGILGQSPSFL